MVLEGKGVNIESTNEVIVGVEFENGMLESVDTLERECEESYFVDMGQKVNFPRVYCELRHSLLLLKGKSPLVLEDMRSCLLYTSRCV